MNNHSLKKILGTIWLQLYLAILGILNIHLLSNLRTPEYDRIRPSNVIATLLLLAK